jgi:hypothetical protein
MPQLLTSFYSNVLHALEATDFGLASFVMFMVFDDFSVPTLQY